MRTLYIYKMCFYCDIGFYITYGEYKGKTQSVRLKSDKWGFGIVKR